MKKSFVYLIVLAIFVISRGLNLFVRRAQRFSASGMTSQTWRQTSSYLERPYTARKNAVERFCGDRRPLSGGWQCRYMEGRVNDRITDRVVPQTDDLVSLASRGPERGSIRSQSVHRGDKCQGQTREPKFRHFTVRYVFGYSPANVVPPFPLPLSLGTILPQVFLA